MKSLLLHLLVTAVLVVASPLPRGSQEGVLALPLSRTLDSGPLKLAGRDATYFQVTAHNEVVLYIATLQIGTPPQSVNVSVDTGSYDLWTYSSSFRPGLNENASSTYEVVQKNGFHDKYNTKEYTSGDWSSDTVVVGGATLQKQRMGLVTSGNMGVKWGIMGVGLQNTSTNFPNVPNSLTRRGLIQRNAFSLYLNNFAAKADGTILFGGVDTAKFDGKLVRIPFHGDSRYGPRAFDLDVLIGGTQASAMFDSGYTETRLPTSAWNNITTYLKDQIPDLQTSDLGHHYVNDSSKVPIDDSLPISIGGHEFKLPYQQLWTWRSPGFFQFLFEDAQSETDQIVMGDAVLRSLYLVYDLQDHAIYVAQAKYTDESNVAPIPASGLPEELYY